MALYSAPACLESHRVRFVLAEKGIKVDIVNIVEELFANNSDLLAGSSDVLYPKARFLLPLGAAAFERGEAVDPKALNPAYLRQKVAEKPAPAT